MQAQPTASHYVNGAYLEDATGASLPVIFPGTGEEIAQVHEATPAVIEAALAAAKAAQGPWAALMPVERGRILRRAADIIRARNRELSELETLDTGKPISETLVADATSAADALEYFGGLAGTLTGEHVPLGSDWAYTMRVPLGVCVGLGAWNYPTQVAAWKAAPALVCGNTMVFKPSEQTPLCALKLAEILTEAGAPPGVFNVIQGAGTVGRALVEDARVAKVSLTGSAETGKKVYAGAAAQMKHVTMELGGKSPLIIFADADLDSAVSAAINANFFSTGQVCSNGTRVFVQREVKAEFLSRLVARVAKATIGDPRDEATNLGPMTSAEQLAITCSYIEKGKAEGARLVHGGRRLDRPGWFVEPTIFADVTDEMTIARDEIFGPVMSVLDFDTEDEVIARANATDLGLSGAVFTRDLVRAHRVIHAIEAGTVWINQYNLTPVELPFGGIKGSGLGRENSRAAIEAYSQLKTVYVGMTPVEAAY
ncbi:NAD/NADP-dependent betaine aldehyde dehydrogenase [Roseicyclus marinus]|uniref:Betaine-aldehyde dehydrogenase n=2 Tax=Roseicyclus marinus TaxID=2161673 RepID=A0AA48HAN7_9RHOB|nr:NAD/NADP-dependent betaine aldehyde dehydrogenase [Roseicyclus marinus]